MLEPSLQKNDKKATWIIGVFSAVVILIIALLSRFKLEVDLGFDVHIFAAINAALNSAIAVLLVVALIAIKNQKYRLHKWLMITALIFSVLFLVCYITHHLLAGEAKFGDANHDGILSDEEKNAVGGLRIIYFLILGPHIFLAGVILPFILFTAYRALTAEYALHKKLSRITWPLWLYVAITGPIVYFMISPYYR